MYQKLQKIRDQRANDERGFTLIELLVVVVIIGILVAIAIPLYLNYRQGAENKSVESDIRNAVPSIEQYYSDNNSYPATVNGTAGATNLVVHTSSGNSLGYAASTTNPTSYVVCGTNSDTGGIYVYNSAGNGIVHKSTQATMALCVSSGT